MVLINDNSTVLAIGDRMPEFALPNALGGMIDAKKQTKSDVIVVVFTCNHCPYAQAVEGRLITLQEEFSHRSVMVVLICSNDAQGYPEDSFEAMKLRAQQKRYPFPYCHDETQAVAKSFGALCTPHCFVFDRDRTLRYKGRVDDNWKDESAVKERNLYDAIVALIEGKEPPTAEANAIGCSIKWRS